MKSDNKVNGLCISGNEGNSPGEMLRSWRGNDEGNWKS